MVPRKIASILQRRSCPRYRSGVVESSCVATIATMKTLDVCRVEVAKELARRAPVPDHFLRTRFVPYFLFGILERRYRVLKTRIRAALS